MQRTPTQVNEGPEPNCCQTHLYVLTVQAKSLCGSLTPGLSAIRLTRKSYFQVDVRFLSLVFCLKISVGYVDIPLAIQRLEEYLGMEDIYEEFAARSDIRKSQ